MNQEFDTFEPFQKLQRFPFRVKAHSYELWQDQKIVSSGICDIDVIGNNSEEENVFQIMPFVIDIEHFGIVSNLLDNVFQYDELITGTNRLNYICIPSQTDVKSVAMKSFSFAYGFTREYREFGSDDAYLSSIYLRNRRIVKVSFLFGNPDRLIELNILPASRKIESWPTDSGRKGAFTFFQNHFHKGHTPILDYFKKYPFGTNNPVMTYLSILDPVDRCVLLEHMFHPDKLNSILSDKLLLAYVSHGRRDLAEEVLENAIGLGEAEENVEAFKFKCSLGLAPIRSRAERVEIFRRFLTKAETQEECDFLELLITFSNHHYH